MEDLRHDPTTISRRRREREGGKEGCRDNEGGMSSVLSDKAPIAGEWVDAEAREVEDESKSKRDWLLGIFFIFCVSSPSSRASSTRVPCGQCRLYLVGTAVPREDCGFNDGNRHKKSGSVIVCRTRGGRLRRPLPRLFCRA